MKKIEFTLKIILRESGVGRESTQDDRRRRVVYHIERFIKYNQARSGRDHRGMPRDASHSPF